MGSEIAVSYPRNFDEDADITDLFFFGSAFIPSDPEDPIFLDPALAALVPGGTVTISFPERLLNVMVGALNGLELNVCSTTFVISTM